MSKGIVMALIMNLISLLFSVILARSDHSMEPLKSVKIGENIRYDCIDIYKQPGLDHPMLQNHIIQMKPSFSKPELTSEACYNETYKKIMKCPYGTVPILRNPKEYNNTKEQFFAANNFHPLTADNPGAHVAGLRINNGGPFHGIEAAFDGYSLKVEKDQASFTHMYIGSKLNNEVNIISAGFMINRGLFPNGRVWTYAYWEGKDGQGCYNTACPGFVQVSDKIPVVQPIDLKPGVPALSHISIHQDKNTGNWWLTQLNSHGSNEDIGYWAKEVFNLIGNGANVVGIGGVAKASPSGSSPPMGNGKFPDGERLDSACFVNINVMDSKYKKRPMSDFSIQEMLDSPKCYNEKIRQFFFSPLFEFYYGGSGGNDCGI